MPVLWRRMYYRANGVAFDYVKSGTEGLGTSRLMSQFDYSDSEGVQLVLRNSTSFTLTPKLLFP